MSLRIIGLAASALAAAAGAQAPSSPQPAAATAASGTIGVAYRSAFDGYQPQSDEPPADWRSVNDAVRDAGGHIGIMKAERDAPPGDAPERATDGGRESKADGHAHGK